MDGMERKGSQGRRSPSNEPTKKFCRHGVRIIAAILEPFEYQSEESFIGSRNGVDGALEVGWRRAMQAIDLDALELEFAETALNQK